MVQGDKALFDRIAAEVMAERKAAREAAKKAKQKEQAKPDKPAKAKKAATKPEPKKATKKPVKKAAEKTTKKATKKTATPKAPNANGKITVTKPFKEIDLEKVKQYAATGMSLQNIARLLHISDRTLFYRQKDVAEFADALKQGRALAEKKYAEALEKMALDEKNPNLGAIIFFLKTHCGWVENPKAISDETKLRNDVLNQVRTHKITANEAAIMFDMQDIPIPDSIRMQASKEQPEPEDPTAGAYSSVSEEEMAKQHAERMAERDRQMKEWLTERRQDVEQLKEATKDADAFSPEKTGETK